MLVLLYRDDTLVAIHKPPGLLVHRSQLDRHETRFAVQMLRDQIGQHVFPVHRLDRGTSGILLFALDRDTASRMGQSFAEADVVKRYLAVVRGHLTPTEGVIDHPLSRHAEDSDDLSACSLAHARAARTVFRQLATTELPYRVDRYPTSRYALVELSPLTGRRHQLRRHLKHLSHPIIGDATHGKGRHNRFFSHQFGCNRLLLACTRLRFRHPHGGRNIDLSCPPADAFALVLDALGWRKAADAALHRDWPAVCASSRP